jgi:hypothetical protein
MFQATPDSVKRPWAYWMATDAVEPIHDNTVTIMPSKHPPNRFDYEKLPQRKREQEQEKKKKDERKPPDSGEEFHIDDYA